MSRSVAGMIAMTQYALDDIAVSADPITYLIAGDNMTKCYVELVMMRV